MSYERQNIGCDLISTGIITGRYDIIHPGHLHTICREARRFKKLYVVVVSNPHMRSYPATWAAKMIEICAPKNVSVILDPVHFGFARREDVERLPSHDVFLVAGNQEVYHHLKSIGVKNVEMVETTPGYESSGVKYRVLGPVDAI